MQPKNGSKLISTWNSPLFEFLYMEMLTEIIMSVKWSKVFPLETLGVFPVRLGYHAGMDCSFRREVQYSTCFMVILFQKKTMRFSCMPERLPSLQVAWFSKIGHHMQPMLSQNTAPIKSLPRKSIFNVWYFGLVAFFVRFRHGFPPKK